MRKLAAYSIRSVLVSADTARTLRDHVERLIKEWLESKGRLDFNGPQRVLTISTLFPSHPKCAAVSRITVDNFLAHPVEKPRGRSLPPLPRFKIRYRRVQGPRRLADAWPEGGSLEPAAFTTSPQKGADPARRSTRRAAGGVRTSTPQGGNVIPWHQAIVDGISNKVKGMPHVALNSLSGGEWPEFVWLDS